MFMRANETMLPGPHEQWSLKRIMLAPWNMEMLGGAHLYALPFCFFLSVSLVTVTVPSLDVTKLPTTTTIGHLEFHDVLQPLPNIKERAQATRDGQRLHETPVPASQFRTSIQVHPAPRRNFWNPCLNPGL